MWGLAQKDFLDFFLKTLDGAEHIPYYPVVTYHSRYVAPPIGGLENDQDEREGLEGCEGCEG